MATKDEKEKEKNAREQLGKFFYDLAKMTFGVMVLGNSAAVFGLTEFSVSSLVVLAAGSFSTVGLAYMGNKVLKKIRYGSIGNYYGLVCNNCCRLNDMG